MTRLAIDIDGVLCDFRAALRVLLTAKGWSAKSMPDSDEWDFYTRWGVPEMTFERIIEEGSVFSHGVPIRYAQSALRMLTEAGHGVQLVTSRPPHVREITETWLADHLFTYHALTFALDKTAIDAALFIDDKPSHIEALRAAGKEAYVFDQPWNRHLDGPRLCCWSDIGRILR